MEYVLLVSKVKDVNVSHFFSLETWVVWDMITEFLNTKFLLILTEFENDGVHRWRKDLLNTLLPTFTSKDELCQYLLNTTSKVVKVIDLPLRGWMIDAWSFIKYPPSQHYMSFAKHVKDKLNITTSQGTQATLVTRKKSRVLYDVDTKTPFQEIFERECHNNNIPFKVVCFDDMSFQQQAQSLSETKVMLSCHGAANTNVFLLPENGHLMEVSFRKYWHCDPVCPQHFDGTLEYKSKCSGKLTYRPYYHKADYHNFAYLFGKRYTELDIEDAKGFLDANPINVKKVFINANYIMEKLKIAMQEK